MALADGSNSRASSLTLRPARANSMIRRRYSAGYGGWVCGMGILLLAFSPTPSTETGQLQPMDSAAPKSCPQRERPVPINHVIPVRTIQQIGDRSTQFTLQ